MVVPRRRRRGNKFHHDLDGGFTIEGDVIADVVGFAAVFVLLAWTASRRARGDDDFLVADRSLGLFPLVATLVMTEFNTSTLLAFSAAGYRAGPMALALPFVFLVGLTFYTLTVAKAWKRFDRLSVAELFAVRYSPALGRLVSVLLLLAMTGFSATYVKSLTLLAEPLLPHVPFGVLSATLTAVVLVLVLPGGLVSVVRSDIVSFVVTLVILPVLLVIGAASSAPLGGLAAVFPADQLVFNPVAQWNHPALPFRFVSTLIVLTCFTYIAAPWYGQKIFAARNERTAFAAVAWAAVLVFALYGVMVLAAAHFRVVSPALADSQAAVPAMVAAWLPSGLRGVGFAVLFAAALTTLAGVWTAMAAMVAADFGWRESRHVGHQRSDRRGVRAGELAGRRVPRGRHPQPAHPREHSGRGARLRAACRVPLAACQRGRSVGKCSSWASCGASGRSSWSESPAAIRGRGRCTASR